MLQSTLAGFGLALAVLVAPAQAQNPHPIRLVGPFSPGGGSDLVARAIATPLGQQLGRNVVVDNKPGGGATIGADLVAKSDPDGLTLLYATPGPQITNRFLMPRLPYDPDRDLTPVSRVAVVPNVLVVHPSVPAELPGLPTVAETLPGFDAAPMNYIAVRGGTAPDVLERLNRAINAVVNDAALQAQMQQRGVLLGGSSVNALNQQLKSETLKWQAVIQQSGARVE